MGATPVGANRENGVEVPHKDLPPDTLRSLAEDFVTRDGTDYGLVEKTLDQKVAALLQQLDQGQAKIFFDTETETINIVPVSEMKRSAPA